MLKTHLTLTESIQTDPAYPPYLRKRPLPREAGLRIREGIGSIREQGRQKEVLCPCLPQPRQ